MKLKLIGEITNGDTRVIRLNIESNYLNIKKSNREK